MIKKIFRSNRTALGQSHLKLYDRLSHEGPSKKTSIGIKSNVPNILAIPSNDGVVAQWCNPLTCSQNNQAEWVHNPVGPHHLSVMTRGH